MHARPAHAHAHICVGKRTRRLVIQRDEVQDKHGMQWVRHVPQLELVGQQQVLVGQVQKGTTRPLTETLCVCAVFCVSQWQEYVRRQQKGKKLGRGRKSWKELERGGKRKFSLTPHGVGWGIH